MLLLLLLLRTRFCRPLLLHLDLGIVSRGGMDGEGITGSGARGVGQLLLAGLGGFDGADLGLFSFGDNIAGRGGIATGRDVSVVHDGVGAEHADGGPPRGFEHVYFQPGHFGGQAVHVEVELDLFLEHEEGLAVITQVEARAVFALFAGVGDGLFGGTLPCTGLGGVAGAG